MANDPPRDITEILTSKPSVVLKAMREAVQDEIRRHKQLGLPMAVGRDGGVVWIPPEELVCEGEDAGKQD